MRCLPSIRTTARTGPSCSIAASSMTLSKRSYFSLPWSPSSISFWRSRTSRPLPAISVEPRVTVLTRAEPFVPSLTVITPVETVMVPPERVAPTLFRGAAGVPAVSANFSAVTSGPTAWAVHLSEPSGQ